MNLRSNIDELLKLLRIEYSDRFDEISELIKDINGMDTTPDTIDDKMDLSDLNKELIDMNDSNMELQNSLTKYINKYLLDIDIDLEIESEDELIVPYEECLEMTINDDLIFDRNHPYYFDDYFYSELLEYYISVEYYMKCVELRNSRRNILL